MDYLTWNNCVEKEEEDQEESLIDPILGTFAYVCDAKLKLLMFLGFICKLFFTTCEEHQIFFQLIIH